MIKLYYDVIGINYGIFFGLFSFWVFIILYVIFFKKWLFILDIICIICVISNNWY